MKMGNGGFESWGFDQGFEGLNVIEVVGYYVFEHFDKVSEL